MPSIDAARRRLRLADSHISVLGLLVEEESVPGELDTALTELRSAGIVGDDGSITGELYPLVATLMEPRVIVSTEITGPQGVLESGAVIGNDFVFVHEGWPGESESEYLPVEAPLLVPALARSVDLHEDVLNGLDFTEVITSTTGELDALMVRMESGRGSVETEEVVRETGAPARLVEVLAQLNCMWRMTVVWKNAHVENPEPTFTGLAVWDCGMEGYWVRELPVEPVREGDVTLESPLRVRRTNAKELWQAIADLLPEGSELG
ncbi:hypothetical protein ACIPYQ_05645 [Streptomyces sp. NPDC090045]|uniref:hypothetical protein n=1 Tax=Streptomyces sp. NPDC090045 TaxID=3365927 RepID=UPI0038090310